MLLSTIYMYIYSFGRHFLPNRLIQSIHFTSTCMLHGNQTMTLSLVPSEVNLDFVSGCSECFKIICSLFAHPFCLKCVCSGLLSELLVFTAVKIYTTKMYFLFYLLWISLMSYSKTRDTIILTLITEFNYFKQRIAVFN